MWDLRGRVNGLGVSSVDVDSTPVGCLYHVLGLTLTRSFWRFPTAENIIRFSGQGIEKHAAAGRNQEEGKKEEFLGFSEERNVSVASPSKCGKHI